MIERLFCMLRLETLHIIRGKDLSFRNTETKKMDKTDQNVNRTERTVESVLRVASMALSIASLVIMIKNSIANDFGSVSYSTLGAFKCTLFHSLSRK